MFSPVDLENWNRKETFEFFRAYEDPFFNVTAAVDVSELHDLCRSNGLSFSAACLYFSQKAANGVREFRIRLLEGELVEFERIEATQTILQPDETFSFCYFAAKPGLKDFVESARQSVKEYTAKRTFDVETERIDLIYYSVIPWFSFTSFKHASRSDRDQTVPRIVFGKYFQNGERQLMPVSVEVNHAIMDGIHVGKYYERFQHELNQCGTAL